MTADGVGRAPVGSRFMTIMVTMVRGQGRELIHLHGLDSSDVVVLHRKVKSAVELVAYADHWESHVGDTKSLSRPFSVDVHNRHLSCVLVTEDDGKSWHRRPRRATPR